MTDKTVPNSVPDPMDDASSKEHETVNTDLSPNPEAAAESDWEAVDFPGQISLDDSSGSEGARDASEPTIESTVLTPSNSKQSTVNTDELIQLIQDLNHCNDALLARVSDLEDALEKSQSALQAEIERTQGAMANGRGPAPQQVAQLLSELDIANDGLRRTTMHNEALQAELDVSQQRVAQLERECTLLQQRFNEKSTALQQAENTCRDLKARLHRQQRYTLQFKAALEKCLNMPTGQGSNGTNDSGGNSDAEGLSHPISMPRSQQIQPWSSINGNSHDNLSLNDLLRGLKAAGQGPSAPKAATSQPAAPLPPSQKASDPEAEALLWQDLERVTEPQPSNPPTPSLEQEPDPWQPSASESTRISFSQSDPSGEELAFTEPSPWGAPLNSQPPEPVAPEPVAPPMNHTDSVPPMPAVNPIEQGEEAEPYSPPPKPGEPAQPTDALPECLQGAAQSPGSPAPLVYPLRSQKKRKSLSAVELPSFGRSPRRR